MMNQQKIAINWDPLIQNATPNFSASSTPAEIISAIIPILFPIAGAAMLVYLIYGGYNWMLSGGDPKKAAQAQSIITNAIIGFVIIFLSYWIVQFMGEVLDLDVVRDIF